MREEPSPTRWCFEVSWTADLFVIIIIVHFSLIVQFDVLLFAFYQDFLAFWDDRFGGKKKDPSEENSNPGSADQTAGMTNGSVKRSSDLAIYEQYETQVAFYFYFILVHKFMSNLLEI